MNGYRVFRIVSFAFVSAFGLAGAIALSAISARETCRIPSPTSSYTMEILVDGRPLPAYLARGTTYIEALKGKEYAVRLTNRTGERVAVALAVDGLNSIDAKHTSARDARKWILAPWESITLSGWQTSSGTARRFVFTSESKSYGSWLGRTSDLGIISAAFFREARRVEYQMPGPSSPILPERFRQYGENEGREDGVPAEESSGVAGGVAGGIANDSATAKAREFRRDESKEQLAATGIGREIEHRVMEVAFDEEDAPASTVSVRYEYREALVRLGVLPAVEDGLARRERARGFSTSGFAPDPYGSRR